MSAGITFSTFFPTAKTVGEWHRLASQHDDFMAGPKRQRNRFS
jgi:hypothetical protein